METGEWLNLIRGLGLRWRCIIQGVIQPHTSLHIPSSPPFSPHPLPPLLSLPSLCHFPQPLRVTTLPLLPVSQPCRRSSRTSTTSSPLSSAPSASQTTRRSDYITCTVYIMCMHGYKRCPYMVVWYVMWKPHLQCTPSTYTVDIISAQHSTGLIQHTIRNPTVLVQLHCMCMTASNLGTVE